MGGVVNTVKNTVGNFLDSTPGKILFPVNAVASAATKAVTGMSTGDQLEAGAIGGTALASLGAMGLFGTPASAAVAAGSTGGPLTAGIGGVTSAAGGHGLATVAASGGVPLLTKVLLGGSVASTLASFFGKNPGDDYQNWLNGLNAQEQAQVKQITDNLTALQSDVNAKNAAVSQIVDNYPHIVDQALTDINSSGLSASMDSMDRMMLDKASDQLAAKYAAQGGFSSGAFNQGLAKAATDLTISRGNTKIDMANQVAQQKLTEANALRAFSQKMLGQGAEDRFTATRDALDASAKGGMTLADINARDAATKRSSLASLGGNLANLGVNIWGFNKLSQGLNPMSVASAPAGTSPQIPGGGAPLPDFADMA